MRPGHLLVLPIQYCTSVAGSDSLAAFSQDRAMAHIRTLAALKSRTAGSSGESKAIRYVKGQFRQIGIDARVEAFRFSSYKLESAVLRVGDIAVEPARIVFDPYAKAARIKADVAFVPATTVNGAQGVVNFDLSRRLVVTTNQASYFRIASRHPAAIVYVSDGDFDRLKGTGAAIAELIAKGRVIEARSANLVGMTRDTGPNREVLISAHVDSAGTPGAQDNGSGVAVLIELARSLSKLKLPVHLRFVLFGAEEEGELGSQAYLDRHGEDLQKCELLFNMDSIGGNQIWIDMRGGVHDVSKKKGISQLSREYFGKADGDLERRWILLGPELTAPQSSNVPPWLRAAILDTVQELGYEINQGQGASSDHQTFAQAGIVATNIAIGGIKLHSAEDVPEQILPASLEKAARIVAGVIARTP